MVLVRFAEKRFASESLLTKTPYQPDPHEKLNGGQVVNYCYPVQLLSYNGLHSHLPF